MAVQVPRGDIVAGTDIDKIIRLPLGRSRSANVPEVVRLVKLCVAYEKRRVDSMSHFDDHMGGGDRPRTSLFHVANVSMSLWLHISSTGILQPALDTEQFQLPVCPTASSSLSSNAFDIDKSPSADPESRMLGLEGWNARRLMSSECVEVCILMGAEGFRWSLSRPSMRRCSEIGVIQ